MSDSEKKVRLDLKDPLVRMMANTNHVPVDIWDERVLVEVVCEHCANNWPCATRLELMVDGEALTYFAWGNKQFRVVEMPEGYGKDANYAVVDGVTYILNDEFSFDEEDDDDVEPPAE